jgi:hypothetical protein
LIARAIHSAYLDKKRESGEFDYNDPANLEWSKLDEGLKKSNYFQADFIYAQLRAIGCDILPVDTWDEPLFAFTETEIEYLAEREHERWMNERLQDGWRYGPSKDVINKTSPYLVPYYELSDTMKDYDRNIVRTIPTILAKIDLKIIRDNDVSL